jgi:hypothetical protein
VCSTCSGTVPDCATHSSTCYGSPATSTQTCTACDSGYDLDSNTNTCTAEEETSQGGGGTVDDSKKPKPSIKKPKETTKKPKKSTKKPKKSTKKPKKSTKKPEKSIKNPKKFIELVSEFGGNNVGNVERILMKRFNISKSQFYRTGYNLDRDMEKWTIRVMAGTGGKSRPPVGSSRFSSWKPDHSARPTQSDDLEVVRVFPPESLFPRKKISDILGAADKKN